MTIPFDFFTGHEGNMREVVEGHFTKFPLMIIKSVFIGASFHTQSLV